MVWFKKRTLKVADPSLVQVPEEIDFIVKDLDFSVVYLELVLKSLRRADFFEPGITGSLELCLKIVATTAIILRTKYCQEAWELPAED
jgi:hypothetical protein